MTEPTPPAGTVDLDADLAADLAEARAGHPDRIVDILDYKDRRMVVFRPTDGQVAALMQAVQSRRMETAQMIADLLDVLVVLLVYPEDQQWLRVGMLDGAIDVGGEDDDETRPASALGLLRAISLKFAVAGADNRQARRAAARRFR
jgi:hypothetical protein